MTSWLKGSVEVFLDCRSSLIRGLPTFGRTGDTLCDIGDALCITSAKIALKMIKNIFLAFKNLSNREISDDTQHVTSASPVMHNLSPMLHSASPEWPNVGSLLPKRTPCSLSVYSKCGLFDTVNFFTLWNYRHLWNFTSMTYLHIINTITSISINLNKNKLSP